MHYKNNETEEDPDHAFMCFDVMFFTILFIRFNLRKFVT